MVSDQPTELLRDRLLDLYVSTEACSNDAFHVALECDAVKYSPGKAGGFRL